MEKTSKAPYWHRLDNNANLFPVISGNQISGVYRLSATLNNPINPEFLQRALDKTLPYFHAFRVKLKHGLFWYYFEENTAAAHIEEEKDFPCRYIDRIQNNGFLFRLSYYHKRINLEIFHALTDGTGGMRFLLAICYQYIMFMHPDDFSDSEKRSTPGISYANNTEDSYIKNYVPMKKQTYDSQSAYLLKGEKFPLGSVAVLHGTIPLDALRKLCRQLDCTITQYFCTCLQWAVFQEILNGASSKKPVNIFIPVNLRPIFNSTTSLNFFSGITVSIDYQNSYRSFNEALQEVKKQFSEKLTREEMLSKLAYTVGEGYSIPIRIVPLPLKNLTLRLLYEKSRRSNTITLSNLGAVEVQPCYAKYFEQFSFLLSASEKERLKSSVVSYGNTICFSFSSVIEDSRLQKAVFRKMAMDGLEVVLESNGVYYETM